MKLKGWAITLGVGAAAGAVAVMMLPKQSATRKLVNKAALKVDDAVQNVTEKINEKWYYFNASGYMQTGWIKWNRQWFYCSEAAKDEGVMVTGWRKIKYKDRDEWFYFADSGAMYGEGFYLIGGKWYGFDIKGRMLDKEDKLQITDSGNIEVVA